MEVYEELITQEARLSQRLTDATKWGRAEALTFHKGLRKEFIFTVGKARKRK